ncbi:hypothetical protein HYDPIDRAFT_115243 [Hydnomerulius pinastri MD-312]|uniref:Uncharacterized protein n=1 Tax=Hydnomerulius pinastri MD-312 TaxID=994086 RepID=A0A0C9WCZ7_9AGAM|nr:hypothetical protein HYDPIDRAFT_115243 [Hydnomerulius pinastri MD-312]
MLRLEVAQPVASDTQFHTQTSIKGNQRLASSHSQNLQARTAQGRVSWINPQYRLHRIMEKGGLLMLPVVLSGRALRTRFRTLPSKAKENRKLTNQRLWMPSTSLDPPAQRRFFRGVNLKGFRSIKGISKPFKSAHGRKKLPVFSQLTSPTPPGTQSGPTTTSTKSPEARPMTPVPPMRPPEGAMSQSSGAYLSPASWSRSRPRPPPVPVREIAAARPKDVRRHHRCRQQRSNDIHDEKTIVTRSSLSKRRRGLISVNVPHSHWQSLGSGQPRSSTSSDHDGIMTPNGKRAMRTMSKDEISRRPAVVAARCEQRQVLRSCTPPWFRVVRRFPLESNKVHPYFHRRARTVQENARRLVERGGSTEPPLSSSLPTSSPLDAAGQGLVAFRASSEMGHYADMDRRGGYPKQEQTTPEPNRSREPRRDRKSYHPGLTAVSGSPTGTTFPERSPSPDVGSTPLRGGDPNGKVKIPRALSGAPNPASYKFGGKDAPPAGTSSGDRRESAKSRSSWNFGRPTDKSVASARVWHVVG